MIVPDNPDRAEFAHLLGMAFFGKDRATDADVRAFVDGLTDEQRRRFLAALLRDSLAGLRPPKGRVSA